MIRADHFSADTLDFLKLLFKYKVKYVIIGGEAVIYYGFARLTGDIDILYDREPENLERLFAALKEFWQGVIPGIKSKEELDDKEAVFQFGVPPNRIDLLSDITAPGFNTIWQHKVAETIQSEEGQVKIYFIGLSDLIANKKAISRPKDLEDLKYLEAITGGRDRE